MKRITTLIIFAGIAIAGLTDASAQGMPPADPNKNCEGGPRCDVPVWVTSCVVINPVPDPLPVRKRNTIKWELKFADPDHPNYRFRPPGIKIKNAHSDLDPPIIEPGGQIVRMHNKNKNKLNHKYIIYLEVQDKDTGRWQNCPQRDPIIINEGDGN